jgi:hypothetical protein
LALSAAAGAARKHTVQVLPVAPAADCTARLGDSGRAARRLVGRWSLALDNQGKPTLLRRWRTERNEKQIIEQHSFRGRGKAANSANAWRKKNA